MAKLEVINEQKKKAGQVELADAVLSDKVNKAVLYEAVKWIQAGKRRGTVKTKTRSEVLRTGKKAYRQKGTGNARHGSMKSAPFIGGGRIFGPRPRNYAYHLPKKVRHLALREALKSQLQSSGVVVVEKFPFKEIKTKAAASYFKGLDISRALLVIDQPSEVVAKSIRNLKNFKVIRADQINVFDILKFPKVVFTQDSFNAVSKKYLS